MRPLDQRAETAPKSIDDLRTKADWIALAEALLRKAGADKACIILGYAGRGPSVQGFDLTGGKDEHVSLDLIEAAKAEAVKATDVLRLARLKGGADQQLAPCPSCGRVMFIDDHL